MKEIEINGKVYEVHKNVNPQEHYSCELCDLSKTNTDKNCGFFECNKLVGLYKYLKEKKSMQNEIKIEVPEGMEIDKENSTFECIRFKPKSLTYADIWKNFLPYTRSINCNRKHIKKLEVYLRLLEVADYLNNGWKPDWNKESESKYAIYYDHKENRFYSQGLHFCAYPVPCFKTEELAKQAIQIIGEDNLKILFSK